MSKILVILVLCQVHLIMAQSKKNQIEQLQYTIDSLTNVVNGERNLYLDRIEKLNNQIETRKKENFELNLTQQREISDLRYQVQNLKLNVSTLENMLLFKDSILLNLRDSLNLMSSQNENPNQSLKVLATYNNFLLGDVGHWIFIDSMNKEYDFIANNEQRIILDDGDRPNKHFIGKLFEINYHEGQLDIGFDSPMYIDALIIDSLILVK
jgi:hypothetical protein